MDRFTRFKLLRALWARAKNLLAWLYGPRAREERLRAQMLQQINVAQRWHSINVAQRQIRDGLIRGVGDPDSLVRPQGGDQPGQADAARQALRAWYAERARYEQALREQQQQRRGR